jgi:hypothetical protein
MDVDRLAHVAAKLFAELGTHGALEVRELSDGLGVCVWAAGVRGAGSVFVGCDESVLFAPSAMDFDAGLAAFSQGRRTSTERFLRRHDEGPTPEAR